MATVVAISGSPSIPSRTTGLLTRVGSRLRSLGHTVDPLPVRDLPAAELLRAQVEHPAIRAAVERIACADGVVVGTPIYKASFSGLLKALLDVLPQFALTDKVVLPLATGGSAAHVLAIDYALRPVLNSLGAHHIVQGWFVLDQTIQLGEAGDRGDVRLDPSAEAALEPILTGFSSALHARAPLAKAG